jgi:hypothetical protein
VSLEDALAEVIDLAVQKTDPDKMLNRYKPPRWARVPSRHGPPQGRCHIPED